MYNLFYYYNRWGEESCSKYLVRKGLSVCQICDRDELLQIMMGDFSSEVYKNYVIFLIKNGFDVNIMYNPNTLRIAKNALFYALENKNDFYIKLLLSNGADWSIPCIQKKFKKRLELYKDYISEITNTVPEELKSSHMPYNRRLEEIFKSRLEESLNNDLYIKYNWREDVANRKIKIKR